MDWEKIAQELTQPTDSKIVLLVMDGLGGLPGAQVAIQIVTGSSLDEVIARTVGGFSLQKRVD